MKKEVTLTECKKIEIEILDYVTELCNKNNLTYFLGGGTLLGAVRHKGFIPWDDDVDIMMPREDYDKLAQVISNIDNNRFLYLNYKDNNDYYYPFAKVVDKRTKVKELDCKEIKDLGVYIDIFPIDNVSDDMQENKLKWYMSIFNNYKKVLEKMENLGKKYPNSNTVACITGRYFEKEIMPKSYIEDFIMAKFEDREYKIPKGYDLYLTKHYGDYMQLPPKEKQVSNHDNIAYWRE